MFKGLSKEQKKQIEYEFINHNARLKIARVFRSVCRVNRDYDLDESSDKEIIIQNRIINIARQVEGKTIYQLEPDNDGCYLREEYAWHYGELELITKRQSTVHLVETICDLINEELIPEVIINEIFSENNIGIKINKRKSDIDLIIPDIATDTSFFNSEHPNIRQLVNRMDVLFIENDFPGVLHASACIFEVLAKDIINSDPIENKPLGSFFELYKKRSKLPPLILDMIKDIYDKRNIEPLAGHGSIKLASIDKKDAIILIEMTKAFVKIERKMSMANK